MRHDVVPGATLQARTVNSPLTSREEIMWWGIGIGGGILYLIVAFTLGLMTLRNGHGWMFFFGIFFPILWIFGAFMTPPERAAPA
jgi:ABC-type multidrug transport system permease subunit